MILAVTVEFNFVPKIHIFWRVERLRNIEKKNLLCNPHCGALSSSWPDYFCSCSAGKMSKASREYWRRSTEEYFRFLRKDLPDKIQLWYLSESVYREDCSMEDHTNISRNTRGGISPLSTEVPLFPQLHPFYYKIHLCFPKRERGTAPFHRASQWG